MVLKIRQPQKVDQKIPEVLKSDSGEKWRRPVGPIV
jgi:hypothetical protein